MNRVTLIGRLAKDVELRATKTGKNLATFTLAVSRPYKKDTEADADFIPCVAWEGTAEIISKYVKKGHRFAVSGRLETNTYEKDDIKKKLFFITVEQFEFLEPKAKDEVEEDDAPDPSEVPF